MPALTYGIPGKTAHTFSYFSSRVGRDAELEMGAEGKSNKTSQMGADCIPWTDEWDQLSPVYLRS